MSIRRSSALLAVLLGTPCFAQRVITTLAGTEWIFPGDARRALDAPLGRVRAVATDGNGVLYIADPDNAIVAKVGSDGILRVVAGNGLRTGVSGDNLAATRAPLYNSNALAFDRENNLYICDIGRIRKVTPDGTIFTVAGQPRFGFGGDGGPATSALLSSTLNGIAFDATGNMYISDAGNQRIRKVTTDGIISTIAGSGAPGFSGDGGLATSAMLNNPQAVAVDGAGTVYFAESANNRVRKVAPNGVISTVLQTGTVQGIALDPAGNLYVGDFNRVRKVTPAGTVSFFAGTGVPDYTGDGGQATAATLRFAVGLAADAAGNVYIADQNNDRVRKVAPNGIISTVAGNGRFRFAANGTPATSASLHQPAALAVDRDGAVLVLEAQRPRIRRIVRGSLFSIAGTGQSGLGNDGAVAANTTIAPSPGFGPGVAVDPQGTVYFTDQQRIRKIGADGILRTVVGGGQGDNSIFNAGPVAVDAQGAVYFVDVVGGSPPRNAIKKVTAAGVISTVVPMGPVGYGGDGGPASAASLNLPQGLAVNRGGVLFISDTNNQRVRKIENGIIQTVAGTGRTAFSGDGGLAVNADLVGPTGLAFDEAGNLYIASSGRVRRVALDGTISTLSGGGASSEDGVLATAARSSPRGVGVDAAGNVYITDEDKVRVIPAAAPTAVFSPLELSFEGKAGGEPPQAQSVRLTSSVNGSPFTLTASASSGGAWLSTSVTRGAMPATVQITADPGGLGAGLYEAVLTINSPTTTPALQEIPVRFAVEAEVPPKLAVKSEGLAFSFVEQAPQATQSFAVINEGGGALNFTAAWSGGRWLTVSPESGRATLLAPATVSAKADISGLAPGTYAGKITITHTDSGEVATVPVTMTLTPIVQVIFLSQSGLTFTAVANGGAVPPQTFGVLNLGAGVMSWTASATALSGGPRWLSVSPSSGITDANSLNVPLVEVGIDPAGLAPGEYYGQVRIASDRGINSPQVASVVLNVLPEGSDPGPVVRPSGLIFTGVTGSTALGSQEVFVSNLSSSPNTYASGRVTSDGRNWFVHVPTDATVEPERSTRLVVQPDPAGLPEGMRRGAVTLLFGDGLVRTVNLLFLLVPPQAAAGAGQRLAHSACTPSTMLPLFTDLGSDFTATVNWPQAITVRVIDDCGHAMTSGSVVATFSTGDPPLTLASLKDGRWSGTWQARAVRSSVRVVVYAENGGVRGTAQVTGSLRSNAGAPALEQVVSAASRAAKTPLAPGSIVSILGSKLADADSTASVTPLPTELAGASVLFAGQTLPLLSTSDGVINAQLPFDIAVNTRHQVVVRRGTSYTVPEQVTVATAQPAVFTQGGMGTGQGRIYVIGEGGARRLAEPGAAATARSVIVIQCSGLGAVDPPVRAGEAPPVDPPSLAVNPVSLTISGVEATVEFAGLAPGSPGLYEVRAVVPEGVPTGEAVEVVLSVAGQSSTPVTMAVQ